MKPPPFSLIFRRAYFCQRYKNLREYDFQYFQDIRKPKATYFQYFKDTRKQCRKNAFPIFPRILEIMETSIPNLSRIRNE
jgi:hypothetical protein